jgi:hypothetical protein
MGEDGAQERTRTSTALRPLRPERSASASSATWARLRKMLQIDFDAGVGECQRGEYWEGLDRWGWVQYSGRNFVGARR